MLNSYIDKDLSDYPLLKLFYSVFNRYVIIYDARLNEFIQLNEQEFRTLKEILTSDELINGIINSDQKFIPESPTNTLGDLFKQRYFSPGSLKQRVVSQDNNIIKLLYEKFFKQSIGGLCLEVTNKCNLRCSYCPYTIQSISGIYHENYVRKHGNSNMPIEVALSAINFYFTELKRRKYFKSGSSDQLPPTLSFYGGEPLLNANMIWKCLRAFRALPWHLLDWENNEIHFSLTTNLTTRSQDTLNKLIENDIDILVSLDGPLEENDKNRVFHRDEGSVFHRVLENLDYIYSKNSSYFEERVHFSAVFAPGHDLQKITEFFSSHSPTLFSKIMNGTRVHQATAQYTACTDFASFTQKDSKQWRKLNQSGINKLLKVRTREQAINWREESVLHNALSEVFTDFEFRPLSHSGSDYINTAPTCVPGSKKIFVSVDGAIHICERTDQSIPLGNVFTGYDIKCITQLLQSYFEVMDSSRCRQCWGFRFCQFCPAFLMRQGIIRQPTNTECEKLLDNIESLMCYYLEVKVQNPLAYELMFNIS